MIFQSDMIVYFTERIFVLILLICRAGAQEWSYVQRLKWICGLENWFWVNVIAQKLPPAITFLGKTQWILVSKRLVNLAWWVQRAECVLLKTSQFHKIQDIGSGETYMCLSNSVLFVYKQKMTAFCFWYWAWFPHFRSTLPKFHRPWWLTPALPQSRSEENKVCISAVVTGE